MFTRAHDICMHAFIYINAFCYVLVVTSMTSFPAGMCSVA